jgi:DNA-binding Lrp family transcriptional regulator
MKDVEVKIISELMKNSRRSDRELAKALGISQPTVTRTRARLEKQGIIKEYTMIPDFAKLGYQLMGFTLISMKETLGKEQLEEVKKKTLDLEKKNPHASLMALSGMGLGKNRLFVTFYEDYSAYSRAMNIVKEIPFADVDRIDSFLVDLKDENTYRLLSLSATAKHTLTLKKRESTARTQ